MRVTGLRSPNGQDNVFGPPGVRPLGVDGMRRRHYSDSLEKEGELSPSSSGSIAWAISMLKDQGMPSEEIAKILGADDPVLVSRYLELHRERLDEHLAAQRRTLERLERLLAARSLASPARGERDARVGRMKHVMGALACHTIGPHGPTDLRPDPVQNQPTDHRTGSATAPSAIPWAT
jgi:hypothetical protein